MARTVLNPTILPPDFGTAVAAGTTAGLGFTAAATGAANGVTFNNIPGQTLVLLAGTAAATVSVLVGQTVLGQAIASGTMIANLSTTTMAAVLGPFHSVLEAPGGSAVSLDFTAAIAPSVLVVQIPGVY